MLQQHILLDFSKKQEKHLLCCANGIVDLRRGELLGPPTPDHFITQFCPIEYDPAIDLQPAIDFFENLFPIEEYPDDRTQMVRFMQMYIGYGLTLETNLQFCLYVYGRGSNCKSMMMKALREILGDMLCRTIPIESLNKPRGTNNDSLKSVRDIRLVLISESNGAAKIDVATYNSIVCGEETTTKGMYEREINFTPVMKLVLLLNDLPEWKTKDGTPPFHIQRRNAFLHLKKQYLDPNSEADRVVIDQLMSRGKPHLIGVRDNAYYEKQVVGNEKAFLRFFVDGAVAYYDRGKYISIPKPMQLQAKSEAFNKNEAIDEFADACLAPHPGKKVFVKDMYIEFVRRFSDSIDQDSYQDKDFGSDLWAFVRRAKAERASVDGLWSWSSVCKKVARIEGVRGTLYENLLFTPPTALPPSQPHP